MELTRLWIDVCVPLIKALFVIITMTAIGIGLVKACDLEALVFASLTIFRLPAILLRQSPGDIS